MIDYKTFENSNPNEINNNNNPKTSKTEKETSEILYFSVNQDFK
jgi:hypothetical protein